MLRISAALAAAVLALGVGGTPARADLKLCNNTEGRVGVAVGYKDRNGWVTEGWWTADAKKCLTMVAGPLIARYYYVFAVDYQKGGSWGGKSMMCISDKKFTIRGLDNCNAQGNKKVGFFEVDTSEERDWTVSLSGNKTTQPQ
jgi:uncharacterized membrane protein